MAPQTALLVDKRTVHELVDRAIRERLQAHHARPGQQCRIDLERRVLRGGAEQCDQPAFDMRKHRILLRLVEAMDLIDEEDGALSNTCALARALDDRAQVGHAGCCCTHRLERGCSQRRDKHRHRRLAGTRWSPQDHRRNLTGIECAAQHTPLPQHVFLAHELVERPRPHARRQWRVVDGFLAMLIAGAPRRAAEQLCLLAHAVMGLVDEVSFPTVPVPTVRVQAHR